LSFVPAKPKIAKHEGPQEAYGHLSAPVPLSNPENYKDCQP
jgi:hypothetical protein